MPLPFRAALFDLDGTLVETHIDFPAMTEAMTQKAIQAKVAEDVFAGRDILGIVDASAGEISRRGGDGAAFRRDAFAILERMEIDGCAHPKLLPGAGDLLAFLKNSDVKIGVVTRNCRRVSQTLLSRFSLFHDVSLSRDDVKLCKPHPEHLWDALAILGVKPEESIMTGDHWMDVKAGKDAGCKATIGILGAHETDWFAPCPPTEICRDPSEILTFWKKKSA